ncbi:NUDIX hydrolase [Gallaecimonas xiamenensis]|uniref:NUDIX hydrolase n=1 Tax=Gallaecimonas xiamenensis 3-C-1 TaxID=745411 RepID=K2JKY6_9GAMM|nr:NUDIX domain-containing protein [Gallaecimonas xiamenensis]EKE75993.1 NUDIX hydrolase [Gallaecimonas xiamenensis 3-C-1]
MAEPQSSELTEAQYLERYDIRRYPLPLTCVDSVLFSVVAGELKVLLVKRASHPDKGLWGLPGGFIDLEQDRDLEACAQRNLEAKTGVRAPYLEQLGGVGNASRDKRGWSITLAFYALMPCRQGLTQASTVEEAAWFALDALPLPLAFDHQQLIALAQDRLRQKALYSLVAAFALPESFTLTELQEIHEAILGQPLQKKSFRRRIEQAQVLEATGENRVEVGRPAKLYRVLPGAAHYRFSRNLEC